MKNTRIIQGPRLIWAIARKDIADAIRNKTLLGVLIGVGLMVLSSQALPLLTKGQTKPSAVVYDAGDSALLREIVRGRELRIQLAASFAELASQVSQSAEPRLGIVIPADFDAALAGGDPLEVQGYTSHWVKPAKVYDLIIYFEEQISDRVGAPLRILAPVENQLYPQRSESGFHGLISGGVVLGVMTLGLIMVPILVSEEKETHTLEVLLLSPAGTHHVLIGKALAGLSYAVTTAVVMFIFNGAWVVHWWLAILAVLLGALCAVVTGLLVGAIFDNINTINLWIGLIIAFLVLPVILIDTLEARLPAALATAFQGLPSLAMYQMFEQALTETVPLELVFRQAAVMIAFILLVSFLVIWRIRRSDR